MKKTVTFGEIMLRLAAPGYERFLQTSSFNATFGGGEANVAVSLANYGIPVSFVTRLPRNDIAAACLRELRGLGVDVNDVYAASEGFGMETGWDDEQDTPENFADYCDAIEFEQAA